MTKTPTVSAHLLPHRTPAQLLELARSGLFSSAQTQSDGLRYAGAHLAALRAAAAILAARATPTRRRRTSPVPSVWVLLPTVAPEFTEWATYFADGGAKRAAAEAGIPRAVTAVEADELLRSAETFVTAVEQAVSHA